MRLTDEEQAMLAGAFGPGVQQAMEIVTALGTIYGAQDLVPVTSVQVAGVSYKNLGEAGLEFLAGWAAAGAKVRVTTTLNPAGLDIEQWSELGFPVDFAEKQMRVLQAFADMGAQTTCTCTPYLVDNLPAFGEHVAWAESSAVSFANSVLGARTNREGGPSALAAAITGRTARFGLHLSEQRRAQLIVEVHCPVRSNADLGALGLIVGQLARNQVPYLRGLEWLPPISLDPPSSSLDCLKILGASMAASGAVALYHVEGVTPDSGQPDIIVPGARVVRVEDLEPGYAALDRAEDDRIDLVWIGCPHASLAELAMVIDLLAGRRVRTALWVTMARQLRVEAAATGLVQALEALGGQVIADTCLVVAPVRQLGFRSMATPSGKGAYYAPSHSGLSVHYGSLETCIEAAVTGRWPADSGV